jgi:hypothetical protein
MLPVKVFLDRSITMRLLRSPSSFEIPPVKLFFPRLSAYSLTSLENDGDKGPENILEDRSRVSKFGTISCRFSGMEPEKALPD